MARKLANWNTISFKYTGPLNTLMQMIADDEIYEARFDSERDANNFRMKIYNYKRVLERYLCEGKEQGVVCPVEWLMEAGRDAMVMKKFDRQGWKIIVINRLGKHNPETALFVEAYVKAGGDADDLIGEKALQRSIRLGEREAERNAELAAMRLGIPKINVLGRDTTKEESREIGEVVKLTEEETKTFLTTGKLPARKENAPKRSVQLPPGLGFGKIDIEQYEKERERERESENNLNETVDKGESN